MPTKQKHPVARIRAAIAGVDLFFPKKSAGGKRRKVKKFLRRTVSGPEISRILEAQKSDGGIAKKGWEMEKTKLFGRRFYFANEKRETLEAVLHELAHFFRLGKNDSLTAHSLSGYLLRLEGKFPPKHGYYPFELLVKNIANIMKDGRSTSQALEYHSCRGFGYYSGAIASVGLYFGVFAADKEREWKKPVSGLFLIREICNGKPIAKAVAEIASGKFDEEIRDFASRHYANLVVKK